MTGPEMRAAIHDLGLSQIAFARLLDVTDRSVRKWVAGESIPGPIALLTDILLASSEARALAGVDTPGPRHDKMSVTEPVGTGYNIVTTPEDTAMPPLLHIPVYEDDPAADADADEYPPPCTDPNGHKWAISTADHRNYCETCGEEGDLS